MKRLSLRNSIAAALALPLMAGCIPPDLTSTLTIQKPEAVNVTVKAYSGLYQKSAVGTYFDSLETSCWAGETECSIEIQPHMDVYLVVTPPEGSPSNWSYEFAGACANKDFCSLPMLFSQTVTINEVDCSTVANTGETTRCLGAAKNVYDDQGQLRATYNPALEKPSYAWLPGTDGNNDPDRENFSSSIGMDFLGNIVDLHRSNGEELTTNLSSACCDLGGAVFAPTWTRWTHNGEEFFVRFSGAWIADFQRDDQGREILPGRVYITSDALTTPISVDAFVARSAGMITLYSTPELTSEVEFSAQYRDLPNITNALLFSTQALAAFNIRIISSGEQMSFDGNTYRLIDSSGVERSCQFNYFDPFVADNGFVSDIDELGCEIVSP